MHENVGVWVHVYVLVYVHAHVSMCMFVIACVSLFVYMRGASPLHGLSVRWHGTLSCRMR